MFKRSQVLYNEFNRCQTWQTLIIDVLCEGFKYVRILYDKWCQTWLSQKLVSDEGFATCISGTNSVKVDPYAACGKFNLGNTK